MRVFDSVEELFSSTSINALDLMKTFDDLSEEFNDHVLYFLHDMEEEEPHGYSLYGSGEHYAKNAMDPDLYDLYELLEEYEVEIEAASIARADWYNDEAIMDMAKERFNEFFDIDEDALSYITIDYKLFANDMTANWQCIELDGIEFWSDS